MLIKQNVNNDVSKDSLFASPVKSNNKLKETNVIVEVKVT